jgi:hypothetical protein
LSGHFQRFLPEVLASRHFALSHVAALLAASLALHLSTCNVLDPVMFPKASEYS